MSDLTKDNLKKFVESQFPALQLNDKDGAEDSYFQIANRAKSLDNKFQQSKNFNDTIIEELKISISLKKIKVRMSKIE